MGSGPEPVNFSVLSSLFSMSHRQEVLEKIKDYIALEESILERMKWSLEEAKNGNMLQADKLIERAQRSVNTTLRLRYLKISRTLARSDDAINIHLNDMISKRYNQMIKYIDEIRSVLKSQKSRVILRLASELFKSGREEIIKKCNELARSVIQIARSPNTLRSIIAGGPAALATEAGIVTALGITAATAGGIGVGLLVGIIPTGKDENGKPKNVGDDWEWLFHNCFWNKQYEQDILSDKIKKRIK